MDVSERHTQDDDDDDDDDDAPDGSVGSLARSLVRSSIPFFSFHVASRFVDIYERVTKGTNRINERSLRRVAWARMTTTDPTRVAGEIEGLTIKGMAKDAVRVWFRLVWFRFARARDDRRVYGDPPGEWNESFKICEMRGATGNATD